MKLDRFISSYKSFPPRGYAPILLNLKTTDLSAALINTKHCGVGFFVNSSIGTRRAHQYNGPWPHIPTLADELLGPE